MPQGYEQRIKQQKKLSSNTHKYIYIISVYKFWKSNYYRNQSKFSLQEYSFVLFFLKGTTKMSPNMEILSNLRCSYSKIQ